MLPYPVDYVPYTGAHVVTQLQLLLFSGLAFFVLLDLLRRTLTITLDVDWFYRVPCRNLARGLADALARSGQRFEQSVARQTMQWGGQLYRQRGAGGILGRTWPTGSMALWAVILLLAYLLLYYL